MKKFYLSACLVLAMASSAQAQEKKPIATAPHISGYAILQYQASGQESSESNTFNLRLARVSIDGRILDDFYYKLQAQINGNTTTNGNSPRIVDAFVEWQKHAEFKVKAGQFKRPFTFENPMHPVDQGFMGYSQNVSKLSGFNDRVGEQASNGRDIGVQIQGDVVKNAAGRALLHYQVGVFNGQGINTKDVDQQKDIIGGAWVMPVDGLRIGVFGWNGSYARNNSGSITKVRKHRYAFSGEYKAADWTFRSEYIHSVGYGFKTTYNEKADLSKDEINTAAGNRADGFYALVIAPVKQKKLHVKARYDMYRPQAEWGTCKTFYEIGADYLFTKNLQLNIEYAFVNDRSLTKHNYNMFDAQLSFRF